VPVKRLLALLPLVVALCTLPVLAGCGSKDALTLDPVASAASKTTEAGSSRVAFETTMQFFGKDMSFSADGLFDYDDSTGSMTLDVGSILPIAGVGQFELRIVDEKIYMRLPSLMGLGLPTDKEWVSLEPGKALEGAGFGGFDPSSMQQDPAQLLRLLRASSEVTEAGTARIRGVETTRYTAKLDLRKSIEASAEELELTAEQRALLRQAAEQLVDQVETETLPVEVYIDDDGLLRRLALDLSMSAEGQRLSMKQTTDFYDFGVDVDVKAPPASQVFDLTKQLQSG
jgi:predicted small lipoprotein YifL